MLLCTYILGCSYGREHTDIMYIAHKLFLVLTEYTYIFVAMHYGC